MVSDGAKQYQAHTAAGFKILGKLLRRFEGEGFGGFGWLGRRQLARARGHFEGAHQLSPTGWEGLWGLGKVALLEGEREVAFTRLKEAASGHRESVELFSDLARLGLALDKRGEAELYARTAVDLEPKNSELLADYALVLLATNQVKRAIGVATNACKLNPDNGRNWTVLQLIRRVDKGEEERPESISL